MSKRLPYLGILACCAVILAQRLYTYHEPLERDLTTYAVVGNELLHGKLLYSDAWDHKPPAIHAAYAVAIAVAGYGAGAVFLLNVSMAVATLLGVYAAASQAGAWRTGGLWAAAFWTIISADLALQANQPNTEVFINACVVWAFAAILRLGRPPMKMAFVIVPGLLFALATLFKPVVVGSAVALCLTYSALTARGKRTRASINVAVMAGVVVAAWAAVAGWFAITGRFDSFRDAVFTYNSFYAGSVADNLRRAFHSHNLFHKALLPIGIPLGCLIAIGFIRFRRVDPFFWALLIAFLIAANVQVALPGAFLPHYYQLMLPPLTIGAGVALATWSRSNSRFPTVVGLLVFLSDLPARVWVSP